MSTQNKNFSHVVERIIDDDPRYAAAAYEFVNEAVVYTSNRLRKGKAKNRHITCKELLDGISQYAIKEFGPLAGDVLKNWGLRDSISIGNVVFNMINEKLLYASEEDSFDDFNCKFDFDAVFVKPFQVPKRKNVNVPIIV